MTGSVGIMTRPILFCRPKACDAALERLLHLALEARVGVDDVPLEVLVDRRGKLLRAARPCRALLFRILLFCRHGCAFFAHLYFFCSLPEF